jgi:hypothetical protein
MGKKQVAVSLRKPPPADPDAFVAGGADSSSSASTAIRPEHAAEGPTVVTRVGERREVTVYLPTSLARQLSVRCVEMDRDVSSVVGEAVIKMLAIEMKERPAIAELPPSPPVVAAWARARGLVSQLRARLPLGLGLAS